MLEEDVIQDHKRRKQKYHICMQQGCNLAYKECCTTGSIQIFHDIVSPVAIATKGAKDVIYPK